MERAPKLAEEESVPVVRPLIGPRRRFRDPFEDGPLIWPIRSLLVLIGLAFIGIFATAACLHPYEPDGTPMRLGTHQQMRLLPCSFYRATGLPCPSCGFTTSFSLLMHGDVLNSLRANCVGTLLALYWLALIPWSMISAWRARYLFIRSLEQALMYSLIFFIVIMLARWGILIAVTREIASGNALPPKEGDCHGREGFKTAALGAVGGGGDVGKPEEEVPGRCLHVFSPGT